MAGTSRGMRRRSRRGRSRRRSRRQRSQRRKRGRRKGEARAKEPSRLERQLTMSLPQMLADLPRACDVGSKRNAKGWIGYKRRYRRWRAAILCVDMTPRPLGTLGSRTSRPHPMSRSGRTDLAGPQADHRRDPRRWSMQEALKREKKARRTLGLVFPEERLRRAPGSERINGRLKESSAAAMSACAGTTRFCMFGPC